MAIWEAQYDGGWGHSIYKAFGTTNYSGLFSFCMCKR
jgi:hypothetical protein